MTTLKCGRCDSKNRRYGGPAIALKVNLNRGIVQRIITVELNMTKFSTKTVRK